MAGRPPGRDGLERDRLTASLAEVVGECGYRQTTLAAVLARAELSEAAFRRHYPSLEACFIEIWDDYKAQFLEATGGAFRSHSDWQDGMRAAAWAFCRFVQEDRVRARLFFIELNFVGEEVLARRDLVMDEYIELVHAGTGGPRGAEVPRARAEAIVGAIWEGAVATVQAGTYDELPGVIPQAMYLTVMPYRGVAAAQEELRRGPEDIARYERGEL